MRLTTETATLMVLAVVLFVMTLALAAIIGYGMADIPWWVCLVTGGLAVLLGAGALMVSAVKR